MLKLSWDDVWAYEKSLAHRLPGFEVRYKNESRFQVLVGLLLRPFNRHYMTVYTTVMFGRVYFPSRRFCEHHGPDVIYKILRHEAVHLADMRRFPVVFQLSYLLFLPTVITARAFWEWRAYKETLRVEAELTGEISMELVETIVRRFSGADYLFMCPFPSLVRRRLLSARRTILEELSGPGELSDCDDVR